MSDTPPAWQGLAPDAKRELLARLLREKAAREATIPLSHGQRALWLLHQIAPESAAYNVAFTARIKSAVDVAAFTRALHALVDRHEMLRTTYRAGGGEPVQQVQAKADISLEEQDASGWTAEELERGLAASYSQPFDLERGPVLRATLFHQDPALHVLLITVHHIAYDGLSIGLLVADLFALYAAEREGRPSPLAPLPARYVDFVRWQEDLLAGPAGQEMWAYWQEQLDGPLPTVQLPMDKPRPLAPSFRGGTFPFRIEEDLASRLRGLARQEGATPYMVLFGAFVALLYRYSGQEDILVGSPTAGRSRREFEGLIGYFVNPVVLRADLSGDPTFAEHLARVRAVVVNALKHADFPFPLLVQRVNPERDPSRSPLFQVDFNLVKLGQLGVAGAPAEDGVVSRISLGGLDLEIFTIAQQEGQFDLTFEVVDTGGPILANLKYATDLFEVGTIERMSWHLLRVLEGVVGSPETRVSELPLLTEIEEAQLGSWNATGRDYPKVRLEGLIEEQAKRTPESVALVFEGKSLSYGELDRWSNRVARALVESGVKTGTLVGVCAERSFEMIVGLVAVMKAGGGYVPLDPGYPKERLGFMLDDTKAPVVLAQRHLGDRLPEAVVRTLWLDDGYETLSDEGLPAGGTSSDLAYAIFTSGSTGRPKGAMNAHRGICNRLLWMQERFGIDSTERVLQKTPYSFDVSVWELFWPLISGATLVIARPEGHKESVYLARLIREEAITTVHFVPSMLRVFLEEEGVEECRSVRRVVCSGEALPRELQDRVFARMPWVELHNLYGPTETGVEVTYWECRPEDQGLTVPIGRPLANTQMHVLDRHLNRVPIGVAGELYIGGVQVGWGYCGRPELTADRFVPDPFGTEAGARLYRTGDVSVVRSDGAIEYRGRIDHQVKIRGQRIELGEIEAVLDRHPQVGQSVVLAREDTPGDVRLVAYVVSRGPGAGVQELREFVGQTLPDHMVPSTVVFLEELPLTSSGKVDRKLLPAPPRGEEGRGGFVAPRTPTEEILAGIWEEVLKVERVGARDDFFELGGHSLLATQVVSRARKATGVELPLREVFDDPTVAGLAARVEARRVASGTQATPTPLRAGPREGRAELSYAQKRLWFLDQIEPGSEAYVIAGALRMRGPLAADALEKALGTIVARHDALRTTFVSVQGRPVAVVAPASAWSLSRVDLSTERADAVRQVIATEARRPYDLAEGPLFRPVLYRLGPEEHVLLLSMHHIVSDGWSLGVLVRELGAAYTTASTGGSTSLPALPVQYQDYARWQREHLEGVLEGQLSYWRTQLAGAPPFLALPTDHPRPPVESHRGATFAFDIPKAVSDRLRTLGKREGATLFMTLLAAFQVVLSRSSGQEQVVVGTPVANRSRPEVEDLVGFFVNTLVLRADLSGDPTYRQLLARVREACFGAWTHADVPFEKLVEELRPERDPSRNPLFQVMFVLQNVPLDHMALPELTVAPYDLDRTASQVDLSLHVWETPDGLRGVFEFVTDLFEVGTIERMSWHLLRVLEGVVGSPETRVSELPLLTEIEEAQLGSWNATGRDYPKVRLEGLIEEQAKRTPESVALVFEGKSLSYGELDRWSNRVARALVESGVKTGTLVGVCAERSFEMIVGLVAVMKAGGGYVPLDPGYPKERLGFMLDDTKAPVVLAQRHLGDRLPEAVVRTLWLDDGYETLSDEGLPAGGTSSDLAYAIFTSGSTGRPKGAMNAHRGICNRLLWMQERFGIDSTERVLQKTPYSFDVSVWELFWPLISGATLVIARPEGHKESVYLARLIREEAITTVHFVPSMLRVFLEEEGVEECRSVRRVVCSGEALPRELQDRVFARMPWVELHNLYGPTETGVEVTYWECRPEDQGLTVPIGRPLANTQMHVLDRHLNRVPIGVAGELYIGGVQVGWGYCGRPELTADRFVPDPFGTEAGARLYRTGDVSVVRSDGAIEYRGRIDHQVKIRGQRIELGEIEAVLDRHPQVGQSVVLAREDTPGDVRLVAYVVSRGPGAGVQELREFVGQTLPDHMVPSTVVFLEELPLTSSGKVDRKLLPAPPRGEEGRGGFVAPRTPTEEILAGIWEEVLKVERVGARDDFFELGGHSLLATQVVSRARKATGVELPLREVFNRPTVAELGSWIEAQRAEARATVAVLPPPRALGAEGTGELSFAQQRIWFLDQVEPGGAAYVIAGAVEMAGALDPLVLESAFRSIVARHEALRTTFVSVDGDPVQRVSPPGPWWLEVVDLRAEPDPQARASALMREESRRGFDLAQGPLFRAKAYRLESERHVILLCLHHIVSDGWSLGVLVSELAAFYAAAVRGERPVLPGLPIQYRDFALWQRQATAGLQEHLGFWRAHLRGAPQVLELPVDHPRPAVEMHRGATVSFTLPVELSRALRTLCRAESVTLFATVLGALEILLWRYTGQEDLLVGTPVASRNRPEIEGLIGCFVNTLLLRADLSGDPTVREVLARVREECLSAFSHQDLPFERLVEELRPQRDLSRNPLFQVMLVLQNAPLEPIALPGLRLAPVDVDRGAAQLDLALYVQETPLGLRCFFEYATDLFEESSIVRMADHLRRLLEGMAASPETRVSDLPLLVAAEEKQLALWNANARSYPGECLHELIVERARRDPARIAAECGSARLTFAELEERSGRLAAHLRGLGVGPDVLVGIFMERSLDMLVGLLGILRAGGAYVPLDPAYPAERLSYMIESSAARVVVTGRASSEALPQGLTAVCVDDDADWRDSTPGPAAPAHPESLAYVIFTSGSTGQPKGVAVTHRSLVNLLASMAEQPGLTAQDTLLSVTTLSFDIAGLELYLPLLVGARLVLVERDDAADGRALAEHLAARGATVMQATPATWRLLLEAGWTGTPGLRALCGGEALPRDLANELLRRAAFVWNVYGPTETTIWSSAWRVTAGDGPVPIGWPIANTTLHVLDRSLNPAPLGVGGELYIGGDGLARGYWGRPDLTAERFVPDPFSPEPGTRLYRTGDLARRLPDGNIECLGRVDHQVKVRGFRIELGEIEAALRRHPGIEGAVVLAQDVAGGDRRLVAYLAHGSSGQPNVTALRTHLKALLPAYMIPSSFVFLDRLPLTPNGKLDRKALAALESGHTSGAKAHVAPRTPTEAFLAELWREALGVEQVGVRDNFFDLGGHSLLAMRILAAIEKRTGHRFHPRDIIFQTLEQLAAACPLETVPEAGTRPRDGLGRRVVRALQALVRGGETPTPDA